MDQLLELIATITSVRPSGSQAKARESLVAEPDRIEREDAVKAGFAEHLPQAKLKRSRTSNTLCLSNARTPSYRLVETSPATFALSRRGVRGVPSRPQRSLILSRNSRRSFTSC